MTSLRRSTWTPLSRPTAGDLERDAAGNLSVPIDLAPDERITVTDPSWSRDLAAAASAVTSVLEAQLGIPAPSAPACSCDADPLQCAHQAARGLAEDDRDAFRGLLARIVAAPVWQVQEVIESARLALERYDRRDVLVASGGGGEGV